MQAKLLSKWVICNLQSIANDKATYIAAEYWRENIELVQLDTTEGSEKFTK